MKGTTSISRKTKANSFSELFCPSQISFWCSMQKSVDGCLVVKTKFKHVQSSTHHHPRPKTLKGNQMKQKQALKVVIKGLFFLIVFLCYSFFASYIVFDVHNNISFLCAVNLIFIFLSFWVIYSMIQSLIYGFLDKGIFIQKLFCFWLSKVYDCY